MLKALEKDRTRRYESASALARDVGRFLNHEAVEAFPPSRLYRFRKFARRNRVVLAGTAVVFVSLFVGIGIATWQSLRAIREKNNVEIARAESEQLASLGLEVLDQIYLNVLGDRLARQPEVSGEQRQLLQAGLDYYEQFVARTRNRSDSDLVIGNALRQVGVIYGRLGDRQQEQEAFLKAIHVYEQASTRSPSAALEFRLALALGSLVENQAALGQSARAHECGARAIAILARLQAVDPAQADFGMALAGLHNRLAWALADVLPPREIEQHHRTTIEQLGSTPSLGSGSGGTSQSSRRLARQLCSRPTTWMRLSGATSWA